MRTILIVDDDESIRATLRLILESNGFHVVEAANGQEALDRLHEGTCPSLILLDLMMPVMDGYEFLERHRKEHKGKPCPIIIITAFKDRPAPASAAGVLFKPFGADEVLSLAEDQAA